MMLPLTAPKMITKASAGPRVDERVQRTKRRIDPALVVMTWMLSAPKLETIVRMCCEKGSPRSHRVLLACLNNVPFREASREETASSAGDVHNAEKPERSNGIIFYFILTTGSE